MSQRRMDLDDRPELRSGSVDFVVNRDYWVQDNPNVPGSQPRQPSALHYVFAIDVSWTSVRCGLVAEVCRHLRELLFPPPADKEPDENGLIEKTGLPEGAKVAIMTFDRTVNFFNLKVRSPPSLLLEAPSLELLADSHAAHPPQPCLEQAQMLVVPDIVDMFLPLLDGFLVDPIESQSVIEGLLDSLPALTADTAIVEAAMTGPLKASMMALVRPLSPSTFSSSCARGRLTDPALRSHARRRTSAASSPSSRRRCRRSASARSSTARTASCTAPTRRRRSLCHRTRSTAWRPRSASRAASASTCSCSRASTSTRRPSVRPRLLLLLCSCRAPAADVPRHEDF